MDAQTKIWKAELAELVAERREYDAGTDEYRELSDEIATLRWYVREWARPERRRVIESFIAAYGG